MVSSLSNLCVFSLRVAAVAVDACSATLKYSAATTLGLGRQALVSAVSSAQTINNIATRTPPTHAQSTLTFSKTLDAYTAVGVSVVNSTFSLAELLTLTTFHLTSSTLKLTIESAEEIVKILDGILGDTDTSKAVAASITLFFHELQGQDDLLGLSKQFGRFYAFGHIAKSMTAYCCLQFLNRKRWTSLITLHPVFVGHVKTEAYNPETKVDSPTLNRRMSMDVFSQTKGKRSTPVKLLAEARRIASMPNIGWPPFVLPGLAAEQTKKASISPQTHVNLGARYVKFAVGAYGSHFMNIMGISKEAFNYSILDEGGQHLNHTSLANHVNIPVEHIVNSSYLDTSSTINGPLVAPVHYIVVDKATESVVVSLRGTLGLGDIITDFQSNYVHYKYGDGIEGYAHSGMFHCANAVLSKGLLASVNRALRDNAGFSLTLTGHSLGGGCASLLALLWSKKVSNSDGTHSFFTRESTGFPEVPINCYVYGCPAVVSAELSRSAKNLITSFVFRNDVVCRLSLGLIRDFRNVTINLATEKGVAEDIINKVLGVFSGSDTTKDELWYWALLKTLRADMRAGNLFV